MISRQARQWPVGAGIAINSPDCHKQAQGLVRLADCLQTSCTRYRLGSYQSPPAPQDLQTINIKTVGRIQIKFLPPPSSLVPRLSPDLGLASGWWRPVSRQHKLESPWGTKKVTRYSSWLQLPVTSNLHHQAGSQHPALSREAALRTCWRRDVSLYERRKWGGGWWESGRSKL